MSSRLWRAVAIGFVLSCSKGSSDAGPTGPAPAASVTVTPTVASIWHGGAQQLTATVKDAAGNALTARTVAWSTSNPNTAVVNRSTGVVTGMADGTATITATVGEQVGTALVTVTTPVATVNVAPYVASIPIAATQRFLAILKDVAGNTLEGRSAVWSTSDASIAAVNSVTGIASGVAAGTAMISATAEGKTASATLTVTTPVASVAVSPSSASILVGGQQQFAATIVNSLGIGLIGRVATWTSSNPNIAFVNSYTGVVTGMADGTATIVAAADGRTGSATVTVSTPVASVTVAPGSTNLLVGTTQQYAVTVSDANGTPLAGRPVAWSTGDASIAIVGSGTGIATAVGAGTTTITATCGGKTGSGTLTVPNPVASVTVTPASVSTWPGGTQQFSATLADASGNTLTGRTVAWSVSNPNIATVSSSTGLATGVSDGVVTVTASAEGKTGSATLTVSTPVASVTVSPSAPSVVAGTTRQLAATVKDAAGNTLTGRAVTWSTGNASVATVNGATGVVTGVSSGITTISATSDGKTGHATVTVLAPVATVTVSPATASIAAGGTQLFTATLKDADGNTLTGRIVTWSTSAMGVATVNSSTGLATGVSAGTATITATAEGKTGGGTVTVGALSDIPGPVQYELLFTVRTLR